MISIETFCGRCSCRSTLLVLVLTFASGLHPRAVNAAGPVSAPVLSSAQQLAVARAFAPTLVFHPQEQYFPVSSMPEQQGDNGIERWSSRVAQYRGLSAQERLRRAAIGYRVFSRIRDNEVEIVAEYWCYYVYNAFTVRGGWLPYRVTNDHPHDLERLYLVLEPTGRDWSEEGETDEAWARKSLRIRRLVANAHDGRIPPNEYTVPAGEVVEAPVAVLVELGAHAMAVDINNDGRFTPGIDSTAVLKLQWGIRDGGATWSWYRESFMETRGESAVRLCGPWRPAAAADEPCPRYALYPGDGLQRWFEELQLSARDRRDVVGRTPWLVRTFGDMRIEDLMVPTDAADGQVLDRMLGRRGRTEGGFVVGFTTVDFAPAVVVGRRYFREIPSRRPPDLLVEVAALFPSARRPLAEATLWGSYSLDAVTNLLFGFGWFSESQSDSMAVGAEVRVGRFRVRPAWRLHDLAFDSRVTTTF